MNFTKLFTSLALAAATVVTVVPAMAQGTVKLNDAEKSTLKKFNDMNACIAKEGPKFEKKIETPEFQKKIEDSVNKIVEENTKTNKAKQDLLKASGLTEEESAAVLNAITQGEKQALLQVLVMKHSPKAICEKAYSLDTMERQQEFMGQMMGLVKKYGPGIVQPPKAAPKANPT